MILNVNNETARLKTVVLGLPYSNGNAPTLGETYDAKSYESVQKNDYPQESDIIVEMTAFEQILKKHDVEVLRPQLKEDCNQIFARDVAFCIDDTLMVSNIIPNREEEMKPYNPIFDQIPEEKKHRLPIEARVEGGDMVLYNDFVFVGTIRDADFKKFKTARTNPYTIDCLKELFPHKNIIPFELIKNDVNPWDGILHLDCTFMPVCNNKAIIYKNGFKHEKDYHFIAELFGKDNLFEVSQEEMYYMNPNVFSIAPDIVVIEQNFKRLGNFLENECGVTVERIPYYEISKMGGLLRCSTMPLVRGDSETPALCVQKFPLDRRWSCRSWKREFCNQ